MTKYYMHTIEDQPGTFQRWHDAKHGDLGQIVYADQARYSGDRCHTRVQLRATLNQIRAEQEESKATRVKLFGEADTAYGYALVEVPDA